MHFILLNTKISGIITETHQLQCTSLAALGWKHSEPVLKIFLPLAMMLLRKHTTLKRVFAYNMNINLILNGLQFIVHHVGKYEKYCSHRLKIWWDEL